MGGGARLVEAGDRGLRLEAKGPRLRGRQVAAVAGSVPVVRVHPLEVDGTLDDAGENRLVGQVGRVASELSEVALGGLLLHFVPASGPSAGELVRLEADHLQDVLTIRCPRGISDRPADDEQDGVVVGQDPPLRIGPHPKQPVDRGRDAGGDRGD
jgi:hypothetical protein